MIKKTKNYALSMNAALKSGFDRVSTILSALLLIYYLLLTIYKYIWYYETINNSLQNKNNNRIKMKPTLLIY